MARTSNKQMYNEDLKEEFLKSYPENTAKTYRYSFFRSYPTEDTLGRDLYTFTSDEIEDTLRDADHTTISSLRLTFNVFKEYLKWTAENGYSTSNILIERTISDEELKTYLDKNKKLYISFDELRELEKQLINFQDVICMRLPFEGISGYESSEMTNLHYYDVDWNNNIVHLKDDKYGKRDVIVSDECIRIIRAAYNERDYTKGNGVNGDRSPIVANICTSDYIIKNTFSKRTKVRNGVDKHTIYRRLSMIKHFFELHHLNVKNIQKSGMIKMGKDLFERDGELTNKQLAEIAERFGLRTVNVNGYDVYNYGMLREFINEENIMDLYGLDINA